MQEDYVRPDPEELLKLISEDEKDESKGRLTIFFGYAPGVGKTYSMLYDAMLKKKDESKDIVIGYVEEHKRPDTAALLEGFEKIPPVKNESNGIILVEPDIHAIMKRKPNIVLIDELAHTNAPFMKNNKRYQDIYEILDRGIDVYTTLNVQHLESLKDVVQKITEISVRENVPDPVFFHADEVKLIDLSTDDLLKRLQDGKIYTKDMASKAIEKFFRTGNLLALRQAALKQVALRIDKQMARFIRTTKVGNAREFREKVVVGISASPNAERLVREAYRLAAEFDADMTALHIDPVEEEEIVPKELDKWVKNAFEVARKLNVKTVALHGKNFANQLAHYATINKATKIVIGKPNPESEHESVDTILSKTTGIDVYIFAKHGSLVQAKRKENKDPLTDMIGRIKRINKMIRRPKK